jgi:DNA ligase 1
VSCDSIEARYLMRSLAGKLRNGLGEQSILTALGQAVSITPPQFDPKSEIIIDAFSKLRKQDKIDELKAGLENGVKKVKHAYNQCPNYDRVVTAITNYGLENLDEHCKLTPGVPLKPMLAYPTKGIQEVLDRFDKINFTCEYKYDGERAQVII